ncbi:hypothetical protein VE01_07477 [Pseudogymnoascus verrucosus]|uniref:Coupling of ubiquitin conjugation to ER degradation protein 1 n=1 Tax=Pseudogymnoascus verrucosus TaxID=342668 RepID=A0A1B8GGM4_9PEZI|nr:uncharacterized protein VE01_07477 [Pseudogymnoascus verrucosus]OBT94963.1 hypothetical protein VE01_07477 [Pseudogymnoascus verrucosus]
MADDQTINLPQLVIILLLGGFAVRYFFFSAPQSPDQPSASSRGGVRVREADVDRVQQMFPQVGRRTIMWDLQRNGGNIAATTERILSGRGLEEPPQTFRPPMPPAAATSSSQTGAGTRTEAPKPSQPDLISRYNLGAKIAASSSSEDKETTGGSPGKSPGGKAWSQNKTERQSLMQQRREEMILAARRKMEAKIAAENKS